MNEPTPDKLEGIPKPLSPEDIEALRKRQEVAAEANELLNAKEAGTTPDFRPDYTKQGLADRTDKLIKPETPKPEPVESEKGPSDLTEQILKDLEGKTDQEKIKALLSGKFDPHATSEALSEILEDQNSP